MFIIIMKFSPLNVWCYNGVHAVGVVLTERKAGMSESEKTFIISMAPELALLTTGVRGQLQNDRKRGEGGGGWCLFLQVKEAHQFLAVVST